MIMAVLILYVYFKCVIRNAAFQRAISHVIKSTILTGRNYLFNYIAQSNYCIIELFNGPFKRTTLKQETVASLIKL